MLWRYLLFVDSVKTDAKGNFVVQSLSFSNPNVALSKVEGSDIGLYRFNLPHNQWFYILNDGKPVQIKTIYQFSAFYNIVTDSLTVIKSEENKRFYKFQRLQQKLNIANYWLLHMMRLYPLPDPFHKQLEEEYLSRHKAMARLVKTLHTASPYSLSAKIALASYQPSIPIGNSPTPGAIASLPFIILITSIRQIVFTCTPTFCPKK
jgi:hypothetical protein